LKVSSQRRFQVAMSKEEQKAASDRIMKKLGPFTAEEQEIYDRSVKGIEDYVAPTSASRTCGYCGAEFQDKPGSAALAEFADHVASHNPSPAQWTEAHERIVKSRESAKGRS
jgi:hypothetical protein